MERDYVELAHQLLPQVRSVLQRRQAGAPPSGEPTRAFAGVLDGLGYGDCGIWWARMLGELDQTDPARMPTTTVLLSAALAEAALCLVVERARAGNWSMKLKSFEERSASKWTFADLIRGARTGDPDHLIDEPLRQACDRLNEDRRRIHVGSFVERGAGHAEMDIDAHEARAAKETLDRLLRQLLVWLERHPAPEGGAG